MSWPCLSICVLRFYYAFFVILAGDIQAGSSDQAAKASSGRLLIRKVSSLEKGVVLRRVQLILMRPLHNPKIAQHDVFSQK